MKFHFYSLRPGENTDNAGLISLDEIILMVNLDEFFKKKFGEIPKTELDKLNIIPQKNPLRWERIMGGIIYRLSGKIPLRKEVNFGRLLFEGLNKQTRRNLDLENVFGFFPYLLSGFKSNLKGINKKDTNSIEKLILLTEKSFSGEEINLSSYLCAHKESIEKGRDKLRKEIKEDYVIRAINLLKGIIKNSGSGKGSINLSQYRENAEGMNEISPKIFLRYYHDKNLDNLRDVLENHYLQMEHICSKNSDEDVQITLKDAKETYNYAKKLCISEFGFPWRELPLDKSYGVFNELLEDACGDLSRLSKFPIINGKKDSYKDKKILYSIREFMKHQKIPLIRKSIIEGLFYYAWGKESKSSSGIGIGLDVDHHNYQIEFFSRGYDRDNPKSAPILYARRRGNEDLPEREGLNNLSIRQFWR